MRYEDFLQIAKYGNENWKGCFTEEKVKQNAKDYYDEFIESNKQGKPTSVMQSLCELLIDDIEGGSDDAHDFLMDILASSEWWVNIFRCGHCNKREIVFFTMDELEKLKRHANREILITDAIPDKPSWIREFYISGILLCNDCWKKYWNGELNGTGVKLK